MRASGDTIDQRYVLTSLLGRGGMGEVWEASDARSGLTVAVKLLMRADESSAKRFLRESQLLARIDDPNVVKVLDYGEDGEQLYLVLEYLQGYPLSDVIRQGIYDTIGALWMARDIARGLFAIHEAGIVHRDIKPANLHLLQDAGVRVKILDLGIARSFAEADTQLTRTGAVIGTPRYMSPEQIRGLPLYATSDIYSFGCVFSEILTRNPVFSANEAHELMAAHLRAKPLPVGGALEGLQVEEIMQVEELVHACLQKDPRLRINDLRVPVKVLSRILANYPAPAMPRLPGVELALPLARTLTETVAEAPLSETRPAKPRPAQPAKNFQEWQRENDGPSHWTKALPAWIWAPTLLLVGVMVIWISHRQIQQTLLELDTQDCQMQETRCDEDLVLACQQGSWVRAERCTPNWCSVMEGEAQCVGPFYVHRAGQLCESNAAACSSDGNSVLRCQQGQYRVQHDCRRSGQRCEVVVQGSNRLTVKCG